MCRRSEQRAAEPAKHSLRRLGVIRVPVNCSVHPGTVPPRVFEPTFADRSRLDRARTHLIGTHAIGLQRNSARAAVYAFDECYGLGANASSRYAERVSAVSAADVLAAAQRVLDAKSEVITLVAPEGAVPPELS